LRADDFLTREQIVDRIDRTKEQVNSALYMLKNYSAIDCVVAEGRLWWFATAQNDKRCKHIDERAEETQPRRPKRRKETAK
jgi:hypothetical protein